MIKMGGGKRKYNQRIRFRKFNKKKKEIKLDEEDKAPSAESGQSIIDLWEKSKEKQNNKK